VIYCFHIEITRTLFVSNEGMKGISPQSDLFADKFIHPEKGNLKLSLSSFATFFLRYRIHGQKLPPLRILAIPIAKLHRSGVPGIHSKLQNTGPPS
ncbi:hypothetical protein KA005_01720, partial [bacterium]|nr:hypothetical protein [bacterium]